MAAAHRRLSGVCLVLYFLVFGGLPLADAVLAASGGPAAAHVEDGSERHGGGHDHGTCQLCRAIDRNSAALDAAVPAAPLPPATAPRTPYVRDVGPAAPPTGTAEARAPPAR